MPTNHGRSTAPDNRTESDRTADVPADDVNSEGGPDSGTVTVNSKDFAALQKQLADLQARQDAAEADKASAVKAAAGNTHVEDIEPKDRPEPEQTYISHTVQTKDADGVTQFKTYRMKTEDFEQISRERGW
jgi:hypothetical protein